jgi:hypothetical protein
VKAGYVLLDIFHGALVIDATRLEKPIQRPSGLKSKQAAEFRESQPIGAVFRGRECLERPPSEIGPPALSRSPRSSGIGKVRFMFFGPVSVSRRVRLPRISSDHENPGGV